MAGPVIKNAEPWAFEKVESFEDYTKTADLLLNRLASRLDDIKSITESWIMYCNHINGFTNEGWRQAYQNVTAWTTDTGFEELRELISKKDNGGDAFSFLLSFMLEFGTGKIVAWITSKGTAQIEKLRQHVEKEVKANYFGIWNYYHVPAGRPDPVEIGTRKLADIKKRYDSAKGLFSAIVPKAAGYAKEKTNAFLKDPFKESIAQYEVMVKRKIAPGTAADASRASYTREELYDMMGDDTSTALSGVIFNLAEQKIKMWAFYAQLLTRGGDSEVSPEDEGYFFSRKSWLRFFFQENAAPGETIEDAGEKLWNDDLQNLSYRLEYIHYLHTNLWEFRFASMPDITGDFKPQSGATSRSASLNELKFYFQGLYLASRLDARNTSERIRHRYNLRTERYEFEPVRYGDHTMDSIDYPRNSMTQTWAHPFSFRDYTEYLEKIPEKSLMALTDLLKFTNDLTMEELVVIKKENLGELKGLDIDPESWSWQTRDYALIKTAGRTVRNVLDNYEKASEVPVVQLVFDEELREQLKKQIAENMKDDRRTGVPIRHATTYMITRLCSFALNAYFKKYTDADKSIREAITVVESRIK